MQINRESNNLDKLDRLIGMLKRSKNRRIILEICARAKESEIPLSSREISERAGLHQSGVIRNLNELEEVGAIKEVSEVNRGRLYRITDRGEKVLNIIGN